jgi:hypothetical protein
LVSALEFMASNHDSSLSVPCLVSVRLFTARCMVIREIWPRFSIRVTRMGQPEDMHTGSTAARLWTIKITICNIHGTWKDCGPNVVEDTLCHAWIWLNRTILKCSVDGISLTLLWSSSFIPPPSLPPKRRRFCNWICFRTLVKMAHKFGFRQEEPLSVSFQSLRS